MTEAEVQMFNVNDMTKTREVKSLYEIKKQRITKLEITRKGRGRKRKNKFPKPKAFAEKFINESLI